MPALDSGGGDPGAFEMRTVIISAAAALALLAGAMAPAQAKGCLKGAAVGGVAGHVAGGHGLLGAGAGCVVGHHNASKKQAAQQDQSQNQPPR